MTTYTVLAPPAGPAGPDTDRFVFVKEGFCWPAFFITSVWLLARRLWLVFILYVVASAAILMLAMEVAPVAWLVIMLFGYLVGLEANNLRRWTLERRGYRFLGVAEGARRDEAEFRFFSTWPGLAEPPKPAETVKPALPAFLPPVRSGEIVGLFPKPGGAS
jgi:hypothetical protein